MLPNNATGRSACSVQVNHDAVDAERADPDTAGADTDDGISC